MLLAVLMFDKNGVAIHSIDGHLDCQLQVKDKEWIHLLLENSGSLLETRDIRRHSLK